MALLRNLQETQAFNPDRNYGMELTYTEAMSEVNNTVQDIWNNGSLDVYYSPEGGNDTSFKFSPNSTSNDINIYYNGTYKIRLSRS